MNKLLSVVAALSSLCFAVNPALAQNWMLTSAPTNNWSAIASSADGTKLVASVFAGLIYTSMDSGATWTLTSAPNHPWTSVASSADGSKLVAAAYYDTNSDAFPVFISTNFGSTWAATSSPSNGWHSVASSADGRKLVAAGIGNNYNTTLYTSQDYGATWTEGVMPDDDWQCVGSSADGSKIVVGAFYDGSIYSSTDSGTSWTSNSIPGVYWQSIAASADGTKFFAAAIVDAQVGINFNPGRIYCSTNVGATWTATGAPSNYWASVSASSGGSSLVAAVQGGGIYTSPDSGVTWTTNGAPNTNWSGVASSADGTKLWAVVNGGGIYTSQHAKPVVLSQPFSLIVPAGLNATFSLGVVGALPVAYQWTSNSVSLPGATNTTLTLTNVALSASGSIYAVQVTNNLGSTLSSNAVLIVVPAIVDTKPATAILATGAMLNGSVWIGVKSVVWFEWGTDTNYANLTGAAVVPGNSQPSTIANGVNGLNEGDAYHYRLVAANDFGIVYGNDQSFVAGLIPSATTLSASGISTNGATLNASINPNGPDTTVYFRWGTSTYYGNSTPATDLGSGTTPVSYSFPLSGLTSGVIYHCQIVASNILGQTNGADVSFLAGPWTLTSAAIYNWDSVASSADGTVLAAVSNPGPIYISTNSGVSWTQGSAPIGPWETVACSADGSKLVAAGGGGGSFGNRFLIYTSTNSGTTWMSNVAPVLNWQSVASSADGRKLAAVAYDDGLIYTSTNSGALWARATNAPLAQWLSIASSADGAKLAAAAFNNRLYTSTNSGAKWVATSAPVGGWVSIASAADGSKLVAAEGGFYSPYGRIYTSTNSGVTWTLTSAPLEAWIYVASSADGAKLAAAGYNGVIYTSADFGLTWVSSTVPTQDWNAVAFSADGAKLVATVGYPASGGIYTLLITPAPLLTLAPSSSNTLLSWTIPSLDFTLQQNSGLTATNWTDVPTPPVLNLTNLQNQVMVSPPGGNTFYRLKH